MGDLESEADLWVLANDGLGALPPVKLPDLAETLWMAAEAGGDPRLFVLARSMETFAVWWDECDEEAGQGLPTPLVNELDEILAAQLPEVLRASPADGLALASRLRADLLAVLRRWNGWQRWYPESGPP